MKREGYVPFHRKGKTNYNRATDRFREEIGLPVYDPKMRLCLRCDKKFISPSPAIRTCGCHAPALGLSELRVVVP